MRLPHSLHWRIAIAYTALIFLTMGVVSIYLVGFVRNTFITNLERGLEQEAGLLSESAVQLFGGSIDAEGLQAISKRISEIIDARVTIIKSDGVVLADTSEESATGESFTGCAEFENALRFGVSKGACVSAATGEKEFYAAVPIQLDGVNVGVALVTAPTSQVQSDIDRIVLTIGLAALVVAFLSVGLGYYLARRTSRSVISVAEGARRLAEGDFDYRVKAVSMDETQELAAAFNSMAATIRDMIRDLSGEHNKLSAVLEIMADGVIVIESNGQITLMNQAAELLLDVGVAEATGSRLAEVVRDYELQQLVSRSLESEEIQQAEIELIHLRRYLSAIATPLIQNGSKGVLVTLHDLTGIRQMETTRKEFVSNVSHELRSPLASIKAMVETLEDGALEDRAVAQDFLKRIHRDVDRMTSMVNDLLELSRLESGQVAINLNPMDLRPLMQEVVAQFQRQAEAKDITIHAKLPDALPLGLGEEEKLSQVLVNLLENALKFTSAKGTITLTAEAQERFIEIGVTDTGIGIAREDIPHVFERFYKVDRARRDGGTGLGLAIVKHIVYAFGGEVGVESTEGVGSTFTFTIPRAT